jgi:hypothetical protein
MDLGWMDLRRSRMDGSTAMDLGWMDLGWMDLGWMDLGWIYGDGSRMDLGWMDLRRWISDGWIYGDNTRSSAFMKFLYVVSNADWEVQKCIKYFFMLNHFPN